MDAVALRPLTEKDRAQVTLLQRANLHQKEPGERLTFLFVLSKNGS